MPNYTCFRLNSGGFIIYDADSPRQARDIAYLKARTIEDYIENSMTESDALEVIAQFYPENPKLPMFRPAVLLGGDDIIQWHRECRNIDREIRKRLSRDIQP